MEELKQRILKDGRVKEGNVLKVDSFLNHQMDIRLLGEIGKEFRRRFAGEKINKILTIEASGIGIAVAAGQGVRLLPVQTAPGRWQRAAPLPQRDGVLPAVPCGQGRVAPLPPASAGAARTG